VTSDAFFQNISRIEPGTNVKFEIASKAGCQRGREVLARFKSIIFRLASSFMPLEKVPSCVLVFFPMSLVG